MRNRTIHQSSDIADSTWRSRFQSHYEVNSHSGCWEWTASRNNMGYGLLGVKLNDGRWTFVLAHVASWLISHPNFFLSDDTELDHVCENRACCNPCHLNPVSRAENSYNQRVRIDNKSGFRDIHWDSYHSKWRARARTKVNGRRQDHHIGYFATLDEAQIAVGHFWAKVAEANGSVTNYRNVGARPMSIEQIDPQDVEWPDEREPYTARHRSDVGRTHPLSMIGSQRRIAGLHERGTGRQTMLDWLSRGMARPVTLTNDGGDSDE